MQSSSAHTRQRLKGGGGGDSMGIYFSRQRNQSPFGRCIYQVQNISYYYDASHLIYLHLTSSRRIDMPHLLINPVPWRSTTFSVWGFVHDEQTYDDYPHETFDQLQPAKTHICMNIVCKPHRPRFRTLITVRTTKKTSIVRTTLLP